MGEEKSKKGDKTEDQHKGKDKDKGMDSDTRETWNCKEIGTRDWSAALPPQSHKNGFPSLFCFTFMRSKGFEVKLLKHQVKRQFGIFACDDFLVVADREISL